MAYFPLFVEIEKKRCVVVGGGQVALRKIKILEQFEPEITVISPVVCDDILCMKSKLIIHQRKFEDQDVENATIVIAATNDEHLNSHVSHLCQKRKIPVNVVDVQEKSSFIFPSIIKRDSLVIAVSTGGNSPSMAVKIKKQIEGMIPEYYPKLIQQLGEYRDEIKERFKSSKDRQEMYERIIDQTVSKGKLLTEKGMEALIHQYSNIQSVLEKRGKR